MIPDKLLFEATSVVSHKSISVWFIMILNDLLSSPPVDFAFIDHLSADFRGLRDTYSQNNKSQVNRSQISATPTQKTNNLSVQRGHRTGQECLSEDRLCSSTRHNLISSATYEKTHSTSEWARCSAALQATDR